MYVVGYVYVVMMLLIIFGFEFLGCIMDMKIIFILLMLIKIIEGMIEIVRVDFLLLYML